MVEEKKDFEVRRRRSTAAHSNCPSKDEFATFKETFLDFKAAHRDRKTRRMVLVSVNDSRSLCRGFCAGIQPATLLLEQLDNEAGFIALATFQ